MRDLLTSEIVGFGVAFVLVVATWLVLPAPSRHLAKAPATLLAAHVVARALLTQLDPATFLARLTSLAALLSLLVSIARSTVLIALDGLWSARRGRAVPRIIRDIIQAVITVALALVALRTAGVEPGSLLTTSALLTAAVALSLQDTLGNLVAGLAIQAERPFDVDDWIQFDADPKHIGKVIEINWRATKVRSLDDVEVIVPNATLAKAPITNFTKPTLSSRRSIYVQVPAEQPPHLVRETVLSALSGVRGVLAEPSPSIVLNAFIEGNIEYWIRFHTDLFHQRDIVDGAARERVWYALSRERIPIAAPNRAVHLRPVTEDAQVDRSAREVAHRESVLGAVDFLRSLSAEDRRKLAESSRLRVFGAGESVVRQGDTSSEMFIVQSGQLSVEHAREGVVSEVATLGPGDFFGEMSLVTGEQRNATVRARTPSTLIEIDHRALRALLESAPDLAQTISRSIVERQAQLAATAPGAKENASVEERSSQLLGRIRRFFAL